MSFPFLLPPGTAKGILPELSARVGRDGHGCAGIQRTLEVNAPQIVGHAILGVCQNSSTGVRMLGRVYCRSSVFEYRL